MIDELKKEVKLISTLERTASSGK